MPELPHGWGSGKLDNGQTYYFQLRNPAMVSYNFPKRAVLHGGASSPQPATAAARHSPARGEHPAPTRSPSGMATTLTKSWADVKQLKRATKPRVQMRRVAPSASSPTAFFAPGGLQSSAFAGGRPSSGGSVRLGSSQSMRPSSSQSAPVRPSSGMSYRSRPGSAGSVCSAPPDVWLSEGRYRGQGASQWRWHGKHGRPELNNIKVSGAPWLPPDPTGAGSNMDMSQGMLKSLGSRRKNKMGALKYKMQAAAYGGDAEEWTDIFKHYDSDGSGELDFDEFRKAIRRHGRMSIRSVTDGELKEVFAVVDTDCGGTVSAEEFQRFVDDPNMGVELRPALTSNYSKKANALSLYDTRAGKGQGLPTGEAPWARPEYAPGFRRKGRTEDDWNENETYKKLMEEELHRRDTATDGSGATIFLPFTKGESWDGHKRHSSADGMAKVWARERRKQEHVADKLTTVAFGGVKHRADGKTVSAHNMAEAAAEALFREFDVNGDGKFTKEELQLMVSVPTHF
jgi:Ca2+-binding EF-hand superfamily protein